MLGNRLWGRVLRVDRASIEDVRFDKQRVTTDEGETIETSVVVSVRTHADERRRCGICRRRSPKFDNGEGRRRWRSLDLGTTACFLEADAPRVTCKKQLPFLTEARPTRPASANAQVGAPIFSGGYDIGTRPVGRPRRPTRPTSVASRLVPRSARVR